jgi:hypothetical protein
MDEKELNKAMEMPAGLQNLGIGTTSELLPYKISKSIVFDFTQFDIPVLVTIFLFCRQHVLYECYHPVLEGK